MGSNPIMQATLLSAKHVCLCVGCTPSHGQRLSRKLPGAGLILALVMGTGAACLDANTRLNTPCMAGHLLRAVPDFFLHQDNQMQKLSMVCNEINYAILAMREQFENWREVKGCEISEQCDRPGITAHILDRWHYTIEYDDEYLQGEIDIFIAFAENQIVLVVDRIAYEGMESNYPLDFMGRVSYFFKDLIQDINSRGPIENDLETLQQ